MSAINDYLDKIEPAKRKELQRIRMIAKEVVPGAEETISYNMPTLKYEGKAFLGFDAHAGHIGIYPYSGKVIPQLADELREYSVSKGAIRIPLDRPISKRLLKLVITCRLADSHVTDSPKRVLTVPDATDWGNNQGGASSNVLAVDDRGQLYLGLRTNVVVQVYAAGASGNAAPIRAITDPSAPTMIDGFPIDMPTSVATRTSIH